MEGNVFSPDPLSGQLLQVARDGLFLIDLQGRIRFTNQAAQRIVGYTGQEMEGRPIHDLLHVPPEPSESEAGAHCPACAALAAESPSRRRTDLFRRKDGTVFPAEYDAAPFRQGERRVGTVLALRDVTAEVRQRQEVERLFAIIDETPAFISTCDADGNITYFNKTGRAWLNLPANGPFPRWRLAPASRELAARAAEHGIWKGERDDFLQGRPRVKTGRSVLQTVMAHKNDRGQVEFFSTIAIDVSDRKKLEQDRLRLLTTIEETPVFVGICDKDGTFHYWNKAARRMLGVSPHAAPASLRLHDVHPPWAAAIVMEEGMPAAARSGAWEGETAVLGADGKEIPVLHVITAHKGSDGAVAYYSTIMKDISDRKQMEARLDYMASHDPLTGVLNRVRFQEQLQRELERARRGLASGALLYLDLDNFKQINDRFGHLAGDETLKRITTALQKQLGEGALLARVGGDEFAVLLPGATAEDAWALARRLLAALESVSLGFPEAGIPLRASIGIATYPDQGTTVQELLSRSDASMYAVKRKGGHRVGLYDAGHDDFNSGGSGC